MVGSSLLKAFEVSLVAWTPDNKRGQRRMLAQLMLEGADYSPERLMPTGEIAGQ